MKCLKVEDALSYLDEVKERFSGQGAIYMDFLDVMREFKMQTIGTEVVIRRVRELFDGHPDLITGFNNFIPQGYRMETPVSRSPAISCPRPTISASGVENISPPRRLLSGTRNDGGSEWNGAGLNAQYDSSANVPSQQEQVAYRATGQVLADFHSLPHQSQNLCAVPYQENFSPAFRGSFPSANPGSHNLPISQMYQQQQQAQSFNHALHYVNKIKNRFQGIPDAYKRFLDILQWYQREQRHSDPVRRKQAEKQVFQDVAKLFDGQEDLLQEFSQFLPESTGMTNAVTDGILARRAATLDAVTGLSTTTTANSSPEAVQPVSARQKADPSTAAVVTTSYEPKKVKRTTPVPTISASAPTVNTSTVKRARMSTRDASLVDLNQLATGLDVSLMHKIRSVLDTDGGRSYQTFLQALSFYNRNVISADELLECTRSLFPRHVDVWRKFCDMIATASPREDHISIPVPNSDPSSSDFHMRERESQSSPTDCDQPGQSPQNSSLTGSQTLACVVGDLTQPRRSDLDFGKLRTCGVSYRALPVNFSQSKCSGRIKCPIATEVLNDTYVSFSSLTSEDSQFVSSKKNQYEENMYRVEDERYEVDMVTELNRAAMQNLVVVKRRMDRMNRDELNRFVLDDNLGGTSAILMRKAIHRVYGDKAGDVIYGLKTCPATVIPLVIQRMRQKDSEWREAIRGYQRSWEEQDSKNYLRSLDHQCGVFKQRDLPVLRGKSMVNQIEAIARDDKTCYNLPDPVGTMISASLTQPCLTTRTDLNTPGTIGSFLVNVNEGYREPGAPHLSLVYPPPAVRNALLQDAASLIIHHVKRQTNTSKEDKRTMKFLMRTVVQDFFMAERFPMSDDEDEEDEDGEMEQSNELADGTEETNDDQSARLPTKRPTRTKRPRDQETDADDPMDTTLVAQRDVDADSDTTLCTNCTGFLTEPGQSTLPSEAVQWESEPHANMFPREEHYSLFYANNHWYSFFRLHHLLICRLQLFRSRSLELSTQAENDKHTAPAQAADVLRLKRYSDIDPSDYYGRALNLVKDLLDGGEDVTRYEDRLRNMFGIYAYPWFTMDRLVANIVRQLHSLASGDDFSSRLTALYRSWTCGGHANSPFPQRFAQSPGMINYGGVRGPLCTRFCRLANEVAYRAQALSILNSNPSGSNTFSYNQSSSGQAYSSGNSSSAGTNCYTLVMLAEASTLLIRLLPPAATPTGDSIDSHHVCQQQRESPSPPVDNASAEAASIEQHNVPARTWHDYLTSHLTWTVGYAPRELMTYIRPVFLYRTVRRCVRALTRRACRRRQQELMDTGDTQPEELLLRMRAETVLPSRDQSPLRDGQEIADEKEDKDAVSSKTEDASSSGNFERDVWEFMCHVFRSGLTRKELFRGTFSSDCMQFTDRITNRTQARSHKLNWSVGSYGIFIRRKQRAHSSTICTERWRAFHQKWLEGNGQTTETEDSSCSESAAAPPLTDGGNKPANTNESSDNNMPSDDAEDDKKSSDPLLLQPQDDHSVDPVSIGPSDEYKLEAEVVSDDAFSPVPPEPTPFPVEPKPEHVDD